MKAENSDSRSVADPHDLLPTWLQWGIQALIAYSIVTMSIETVPDLSTGVRSFLDISETVVVIVFTAEFLVLWFLSDQFFRFPCRAMSIVDLVAILPFYLGLGIDLRGIRVVRMTRLFRIFKLGRYNATVRLFIEAFRRTAPEMLMTMIVVGIFLILSAMGLYYAEHAEQPEKFASIPHSLWFAVVTLTTVGYGDVYPLTLVGKCIAAVIMLAGIGVIAIPTSILSGAFRDLFNERREHETNAKLLKAEE